MRGVAMRTGRPPSMRRARGSRIGTRRRRPRRDRQRTRPGCRSAWSGALTAVRAMETSASCEARSAPLPYPTSGTCLAGQGTTAAGRRVLGSRGGMHLGRGIALAMAVLLVAAMPPAARADTPWSIGAAKVDTTPPAFDAAQDLQDFPEVDAARGITCPRDVYNGRRLWRFEEPYQDTDGSGDFNYPGGTAEPFCDYNHNGRWEGIYLSGGIDQRAKFLHDPIDARAIAVTGDNGQTIALVSVVAQGIFENYIAEARAKAEALAAQVPHQASCGHIDEMVVSSNHNESSPDTVGIYGAPPDPSGNFPLNSGIDEYYMDWLDDQIASAAVAV